MQDLSRRAIISRLLITSMSHVTQSSLIIRTFGPGLDDIMISCAIIIGHHEGVPMSASDIAGYVNLPRSTVIRKLQKMALFGVISFSKDGARTPVIVKKLDNDDYVDRVVNAIHQASDKLRSLSKMDG
jgi:predicted transcriptional regulator